MAYYGLVFSWKLQTSKFEVNDGFVYYKHALFHFTRHSLVDWSGVDYLWIIVMFLISCLDSHSDGTHSLQRIHWWASDVMINFSKSVLMKKQVQTLQILVQTGTAGTFYLIMPIWGATTNKKTLFSLTWINPVNLHYYMAYIFRLINLMLYSETVLDSHLIATKCSCLQVSKYLYLLMDWSYWCFDTECGCN